ncbi:hypothetical protein NDU88_004638, partial [Pleurodeles waltl]
TKAYKLTQRGRSDRDLVMGIILTLFEMLLYSADQPEFPVYLLEIGLPMRLPPLYVEAWT